MKGIFITATGTDIGKTFITAILIKKLRQAGMNCGYYKAALSGAEEKDDILIAGDADYVYKTAGIQGNPNDAVSYIFKPAVSPHLAAHLSNVEITMSKIESDFDVIKRKYSYVTVEGSGGIICPISTGKEKIMLTDIIKKLGLSIILIADSGLGTLNNTILTLEYIKKENIAVNALILNNYDNTNIIHLDNKKYLAAMLDIPVYTCFMGSSDIDISVKKLESLYDNIK